MSNQVLPITIKGHLIIKDDLGNILVDKANAIHPMNMSRAIARALAKEDNYFAHRMAFGNGGTQIGVGSQIEYNCTNTGHIKNSVCAVLSQPTSGYTGALGRLYNETYSEIINESDVNVDTGPGSVDPIPGAGVNADNSVVSTEPNVLSVVTITVELNENEPTGQLLTDINAPLENPNEQFTFDEIGLYTTGRPPVSTSGYQFVNVSDKNTTDNTGLLVSTVYDFTITVDGGAAQILTITTPVSGSGVSGAIIYSDLIPLINAAMVGASASVGASTFGKLKFTSNSTGLTSTINLVDGGTPATNLFSSLLGFSAIEAAVGGQAAGVQNDSVNSVNEVERMLTHVIFSPVLKSKNRNLSIIYTLTISVS